MVIATLHGSGLGMNTCMIRAWRCSWFVCVPRLHFTFILLRSPLLACPQASQYHADSRKLQDKAGKPWEDEANFCAN